MSGGVGGRGSDELLPSSTQPRRRPSLSMIKNDSPPRLRAGPSQRWSPEIRRLSHPHEGGGSSGRSSAPRIHSGSPDLRREGLLPPAAISPPPRRRSSRDPPRSSSGSIPAYYDDRYTVRGREYPESALPERPEHGQEGAWGPAGSAWQQYAPTSYGHPDRPFVYGPPPPPPPHHIHPPGSSGATPAPPLPTSQAHDYSSRARRSPRRAFTYPGVESSYIPATIHGASQRQVSGYVASSAAGPGADSGIGASRGRYDRTPRASLPQPPPTDRLPPPRTFFTPLATLHRDFSAWSGDLVDVYRLGWEDAMTAVAEGQFHVDGVIHHRVPLWPPPSHPRSQSRPPTAREPNLDRDVKRELDRKERERGLEREHDVVPHPSTEPRLSPPHSLATRSTPYPAPTPSTAFPPHPPHAQPPSNLPAQTGAGSAAVPDYSPYPPSNAPYHYAYAAGHYPPGPYDHPSYTSSARVVPASGYGGHPGVYSRAPQQQTPYMRNRQIISCHPCRSRKVKCSGGHPCEACIKIKKTSECEYEKTVRRRGKGKKSLMGESEWQPDSQQDDSGRADGGSEDDEQEAEHGQSGAATSQASQATSVASRPSHHSSERTDNKEANAVDRHQKSDDSPNRQRPRNEHIRGTKRPRSDSKAQAGRRLSAQPRRP